MSFHAIARNFSKINQVLLETPPSPDHPYLVIRKNKKGDYISQLGTKKEKSSAHEIALLAKSLLEEAKSQTENDVKMIQEGLKTLSIKFRAKRTDGFLRTVLYIITFQFLTAWSLESLSQKLANLGIKPKPVVIPEKNRAGRFPKFVLKKPNPLDQIKDLGKAVYIPQDTFTLGMEAQRSDFFKKKRVISDFKKDEIVVVQRTPTKETPKFQFVKILEIDEKEEQITFSTGKEEVMKKVCFFFKPTANNLFTRSS